jgi:iron complex transport system substrate-binding protein
MHAPTTHSLRLLPCLLLLLVIGAGPLRAEGASGAASWPRSVADDAGTVLTLAARPRRIVSLTIPTDEILLGLVEAGRLAAVTSFVADPALSKAAPLARSVPVKLAQVNVELIVSLVPDVVFAASWTDAAVVRQLRAAGVALYLVRSPSSVAGIRETIGRIARVVGEEEKGRELVGWMDDRLAAVSSRVAAVPAQRRMSVMDYNTWSTSMGSGSSWDEVVRLAGLTNVVAGLAADRFGEVAVSREKLLTLDPDILLLPAWVYGDPGGADRFLRQIVNDPALRGMTAVRQGRVLVMPENLKSSTSQYIVLAVEELARYAYPDAFR